MIRGAICPHFPWWHSNIQSQRTYSIFIHVWIHYSPLSLGKDLYLVYTPVWMEPIVWPFNPPLHREKWHGFHSKASYLLPIKQLHRFHCIQIKLPFYLASLILVTVTMIHVWIWSSQYLWTKVLLIGLWKIYILLINDENVERLWAIIANIKWHCRWRGVSGCNYTTRQLSASNLSLGSPKV